jgi:hypothetical protein
MQFRWEKRVKFRIFFLFVLGIGSWAFCMLRQVLYHSATPQPHCIKLATVSQLVAVG